MKKKLLTLLIGVSLVVTLVVLPFMTACAPEEVAPTKVVKVGWINAMSGPLAVYGLPALTGLNMWMDEVNAAGGLRVGDERYYVEIIPYDSEGTADKALLGARKLVLEDEVDMILSGWGEPCMAIQPFLTEQKILNFTMVPYVVAPDSPYMLCVAGGAMPSYFSVSTQYTLDTYPEIKTAAVAVLDQLGDTMGEGWYRAVLEANDIDVVYHSRYSPATTDFAPVASAVLATDPDLICLGSPWPDMAVAIFEQLYLQGFEGIIQVSEVNIELIATKSPIEWLEARKCISHLPRWDAPMLPDVCNKFYADWMTRYGPGGPEDQQRDMLQLDYWDWKSVKVWQGAVENCGSIDSATVRDWLLAQETIPHPMGPAVWWGEELYGVDHVLLIPQPVTEIRGGKNVMVDMRSIAEWCQTGDNKELVIKWITEYGMMWWQRL